MTFSTESPVDGEPLDPVEPTEPSEVEMLVAEARRAGEAWAARPLADRIDVLLELKPRILSRAEEIAELVHREVGKPIEEAALAEVLPNADLVDYWCDSIEELLDRRVVELDPLSYPGKQGHVQHDPRGVVALITPWNYPLAIPLRTLVPALLAGNAVVFKPSEITPRCGALVASLFEDLLPKGVLQLAQGGGEVGKALVTSDVDLVVFTGSVPTGRAIAVACAERLIPCSLELGGKDAAIVLDDCDLERAAQGVVWGAFTNAGQNCAAVERVYVHEAIAERFLNRVVEVTEGLRPGVDTAYMTTAAQREKVRAHLEAATSSGAEVLTGGDEGEGLAFPPTVVRIDDEDAPTMNEETFGPLLPVVVVKSADEAIEKANASRYALTTSLWTKNYRWAREATKRLRSGVVTVNNHAFTAALPAAPWTGTGDTGYGITNSPHVLSSLTRVRFVLEDRNRAKRELWWYPYTPVLRTIAFAMAKVRGGAGLIGRVGALLQLLTSIPKRLLGG
ncbi:MAG TPA: aldehyde dehydrogenase family protein [Polyangiaceae bacterium]|nr:aldehyde dehydrogenase family protein [Polyangiaceae bacterium]